MPYLSASAVMILYEEALYQVYAPLPFYLYRLVDLIVERVQSMTTQVRGRTAVGQLTQLCADVDAESRRRRQHSAGPAQLPTSPRPQHRVGGGLPPYANPANRRSSLPAGDDVADHKQFRFASSATARTVGRQEPAATATAAGSSQRPAQHGSDELLPAESRQLLRRQISPALVRADPELLDGVDTFSRRQRRQRSTDREEEEAEADCSATMPSKNSSCRSSTPSPRHRTVGDRSGKPYWGAPDAMLGDWTAVSLGADQIERVELFYASHGSEIFVFRCLARLYLAAPSIGIC